MVPGLRGHHALPASNSPHNQKRLGTFCNCFGKRGIGRIVRQILSASEEPHECPALMSDVISYRPTKHRVPGFERVKNRPLCRRSVNVKLDFAIDAREGTEVRGKDDSDHYGLIKFQLSRSNF